MSFSDDMRDFYAMWDRQVRIMCDRSQLYRERLAALRWINNAVGEDHIPDDLERHTDELIREGFL